MKKLNIILIYFLFIFFLFSSCKKTKENKLVSLSGFTMGTIYNVKFVVDSSFRGSQQNIKNKISIALKKFNSIFSVFEKDSVISRFNRHKSLEPFNVPKIMINLLQKAIYVSEFSDGFFDVTIAPLIRLWGFGTVNSRHKPLKEDIEQVLKKCGYKNLIINDKDLTLIKKNIFLECNLSAIAKGAGVDEISQVLSKEGIINYMVEIGGEVRCKGRNQLGNIWRVGILSPNQEDISLAISLDNCAIATSGDYRNYFMENKQRYSHTISPFTGEPIKHNLASVSVIASNCMDADAWATAISVMGAKKGLEKAEKMNLAVYMIVREDEHFKSLYSSLFKDKYIKVGK